MDIVIEGDKLDFKIENEKNVLEIVECLERWLAKSSKLIDEIKVDDSTYLLSDRDLFEEKLLSLTKKIEIKTIHNNDYAINSLMEVASYINNFLSQINKEDFLGTIRKEEIIEGLKWINDIIINSARILCVATELLFYYEKSLLELLSKNNIIIVELEKHKYNPSIFGELTGIKLKNNLQNILYYLPKIVNRSILHFSAKDNREDNKEVIITNLNGMVDTIESFLPIIPNIGYILHSGKESQGYLEIKNILLVMESMVYCLKRVEFIYDIKYSEVEVDNENINLINKDFNGLLQELSNALLKKDIVLLCDLLEYELIEKLSTYKRIFEDLIVLIDKKHYP